MKRKLLTLAVILALIVPARAQEKEEKMKELEKLEQQTEKATPPDTLINEEAYAAEEELSEENQWIESPDTTRVKVGDIVTVEETDDETIIRIGKKSVKIIEDGNDTEIRFEEYEEPDYSEHPGRAFKGHVGGIEFAFNNYSTDTWGRNDEPLEDWLDLNTTKSSSFNIVSPPVSLGFSRRFGLVTALGINFNNYFFDNNNTIIVDEEGMVAPSYPEEGITYEKSKLATVYGTIPVMLEVQIPVNHNRTINLGAGMIGAIKFGSHTKTVYRDDEKQKDKNHDDFNLNLLRYGVTARAGYEMFQVYGTCYLSPMFEENRGPVLYPYEVGIALTIND
jgi:plastocyanin